MSDIPEYVLNYQLELEKQLQNERIKRYNSENALGESSGFSVNSNQGIVEFQLDVKEILDRVYHMLSSHEIGLNENNQEVWQEPKDDRLKTLSEYGVKKIMEILQLYVNPNTLLSNYKEDMIMWKVRDFGIEVSDLIFLKYEDFFFYPKPEELLELYWPIVQEKGLKITEEELYQKCLIWSNDELKAKLRHYPTIVQSLVDTVHSTYLRALNGEERESLRKQMHISQSTNTMPLMQQQPQRGGIMSRILPKKV